MDGRPDAPAGTIRLRADPCGRPALGVGVALEVRHVLDGHLDRDLHRLDPAGVDDGDLAIGAAEKAGRLAQRALGGRQPDALRLGPGDRSQPFQAEGQMGASLGLGHRVDLVDDHPSDAGQDLPRRAGEQEEQRLGRRDQDVGRVALDLPALTCRRIAGADRHADRRQRDPHALSLQTDTAQGRLQVALDVHRERLERRDIQDAAAFGLCWDRFGRQPIDAPEERRQRLAAAGGGRHQGVLAGRYRSPAAVLDLGRGREGARKPGPRRRRKKVQNSGHRSKFRRSNLKT